MVCSQFEQFVTSHCVSVDIQTVIYNDWVDAVSCYLSEGLIIRGGRLLGLIIFCYYLIKSMWSQEGGSIF